MIREQINVACGDARAWDAELQRILQSELFSKRPVMLKLLSYLAERSLGGEENLRSYQVAVEGLGRNSDYDPAVDSYARVQVGRLRTALEVYYARCPDDHQPCLYIPHGTYQVKLAPRAIAYPAITGSSQRSSSEVSGSVTRYGQVVEMADQRGSGRAIFAGHGLCGAGVGSARLSLAMSFVALIVSLFALMLGTTILWHF